MKTVPELLREGANTYEERNKIYGDNYKRHGMVMQALFPEGVQLDTVEDHNRFGILTQMVAKLTRYCQNWHVGGHEDSLHDLMVYTPMLQELDNERREYLAILEAEMWADALVMGTGSSEAEVQSITPDWSAVEEKFGAVHKDEDAVAQPPVVVEDSPQK